MAKHLISLAAGSGRRFGGNKLLYPLEGRPLFSYGLETLCRAVELRPECELTVVSRYPQILEAARAAGAFAVGLGQSQLRQDVSAADRRAASYAGLCSPAVWARLDLPAGPESDG